MSTKSDIQTYSSSGTVDVTGASVGVASVQSLYIPSSPVPESGLESEFAQDAGNDEDLFGEGHQIGAEDDVYDD